MLEPAFKDILFKLIGTRSYTGEEANIVREIIGVMESLGYDEAYVDEVGNVIGVLHGTKEGAGKCLLFDGHIDTVEAENKEEWKATDPFTPLIKDDLLYGRGASDMKGAFGSMVYGLSQLSRDSFSGDIYVSGTVHEETAEGFSILPLLKKVKPDVVIIGEATKLQVNTGQRGRGEVVLKTFGKSAHSSNPDVGINSVLKMMKALQAIEGDYVVKEDVLGKGILVLTDIISTPYPGASVIPRVCEVTFDRRLLLGETRESVLAGIDEVLAPIKKEDEAFNYELYFRENSIETYKGYEITGDKFYPPWKIDEESQIVKGALKALKSVGIDEGTSSYSFCTNGSSSAGILEIDTIGFGPGRESEAHITDEYIKISDLEKAAKGYEAIARELLQ